MAITSNKNFLSPLGFSFQIKKAPNVNFFVQNVNVPDLIFGESVFPTPFIRVPVQGDHVIYGDLAVTFAVDEEMQNFAEIYDWMNEIGFPDSYEEYKRISSRDPIEGDGVYSDISLFVLSSQMNPIYEIKFEDAFPTSLGGMNFDTRTEDIQYVTAQATFKFRRYYIIPLTTS
jgi:hypothetical protein